MNTGENLLQRLCRILPSSGNSNAFFANLLIGGSIALLVYFVEQAGMIEHILNHLLYLLLKAVGGILDYKRLSQFTREGVAIDAVTVIIAAACWTYFTSLPARLCGNLLLFVTLVPVTIVMLDHHGILLGSAPIALVITAAIAIEAGVDRYRNRQRRKLVEEKQEAEYSVIRHLAHNVKPGLQIVRSPLVALRDLLESRGLLATELSTRLDGSVETVGDALKNAITSLGQINDIIDNTRRLVTREIHEEDFSEVELQELLTEEVFPLHGGKFRLVVEGGPVRLRLHRESFVEAINNLLRNAEVHGFPDRRTDGEVRFSLRQTRKRIVIDYCNNGRPFPDNLSERDFLSFGRKGADSPGEGLGGAWIGRVIEAHGGDFEIIRDGQPVHFRITLLKRGS